MAVEWLTFHLTDRCQLDCQHCLRDPESKPKDLDRAIIRQTLEEGKRIYRAFHAGFTGGEPTLHPEFLGIIDDTVALGFTWHMVSNGKTAAWLFEKLLEKPSRKDAMTSITLSLDGADEEMHDGIRGAGSYREVLRAASLCQMHDMKFVIQTVIHQRNQHQIEAIGLLASQLGAARLSFAMTVPTGTHFDESFYLTPKAWRRVMDRIDRLSATLKLTISSPEGFWNQQPLHVCAPFASQQLHIDVDGNLELCCQHAGVPQQEGARTSQGGNLREKSLTESHRSVLGIIQQAQLDKLEAMTQGSFDQGWDEFPCNWCLKYFGKPHWDQEGAAGPGATRERWRGAWSKGKSLPIVQ
ncbi:MAG: radical SAM protein [Deltaproteobacteria bacterium]|nr:radical SAM protein [Deltaproteobacteria bacterium]